VDLVVAIGYDEHIGKTRDLLIKIMVSHPLVLEEPVPTVEVVELGSNNIRLALQSWTRISDYSQCGVICWKRSRLTLKNLVLAGHFSGRI
jgi:small conductance mechanosensitive channel